MTPHSAQTGAGAGCTAGVVGAAGIGASPPAWLATTALLAARAGVVFAVLCFGVSAGASVAVGAAVAGAGESATEAVLFSALAAGVTADGGAVGPQAASVSAMVNAKRCLFIG